MRKRIIYIFCLVIIALGIVACKKNIQSQETDGSISFGTEEKAWVVSHTDLGIICDAICLDNNVIYAAICESSGYVIRAYDSLDMTVKAEYYIYEAGEISKILYVDALYVLGKTGEDTVLWKINNESIEPVFYDISDDCGLYPELLDVFFDSNGKIYLWYESAIPYRDVFGYGEDNVYYRTDRIYAFDKEMHCLGYEQVQGKEGDEVICAGTNLNGDAIIFVRTKTDEGESKYGYRELLQEPVEKKDDNFRELSKAVMERCELSFVKNFYEGHIVYIYDGIVHLYSIDQDTDRELFSLSDCGINESEIYYLRYKDGEIEFINSYQETAEYSVARYEATKQVTITLGMMSYDEALISLISSFNRKSQSVKVKPQYYCEDGDYEKGFERLKLELIQGNGPDVISAVGIDYEVLAAKGVFADLAQYMIVDEEVNANTLVKCVKDAYSVNGAIYSLGPVFSIYAMWGPTRIINGRTNMSMAEMLDSLGGDMSSIFGLDMADESILANLVTYELDTFIEWDTCSCNFVCDKFFELLRLAQEYKNKDLGDSYYRAIREGKISIVSGVINSPLDFALERLKFGESIEPVNYPISDGSGFAISMIGAVGINSSSKHKDEAWNFVKHYVVDGARDKYAFPVIQKELDQYLDESLKDDYDGTGETSEIIPKLGYSEPKAVSVVVYHAEPEDIDAVNLLLENITKKREYNFEILSIIEEEAEYFFVGQKSAKEVATLIQNRVSTYLTERGN